MKEGQGREGGGYIKEVKGCSDQPSPSSLYPRPKSCFTTTAPTLLCSKLQFASFPSCRACSKVSHLLFYLLFHLLLLSFKTTRRRLLFENVRSLAYSFAIMPAATAYRQPTFPSLPLTVPGKSPYYTPPARTPSYSRVSMSSPEASSSVNTSAVPSLTSSTYGGSAASDYDSPQSGSSGVDLIDMLNDRLSNAVDPIPLDRSLAKQAQT